MKSVGRRTGIIAGSGDLPIIVASTLSAAGTAPYIAALKGITSGDIEKHGWNTEWFQVTRLGSILKGLQQAGVTELIMAGKVKHELAISKGEFDPLLRDLIAMMPDLRGSTILGQVADLFESHGMTVLSIRDVLPEMISKAGLVAGPEPTPTQLADIAFGWPIAKSIAEMDIGQTVAVNNLSIIGVEAMEGTDEIVRRCGKITGGGNIIIKVTSPSHDFRFDIPTLGLETVRALAETGGGVLAMEAETCLLLQRDEVSAFCNSNGIPLLGIRDGNLGIS